MPINRAARGALIILLRHVFLLTRAALTSSRTGCLAGWLVVRLGKPQAGSRFTRTHIVASGVK
jgi:hypothetical protein